MKVVKVNGDEIMIKKTLINMLVIVLSVQGITHSGENKSTQEIMKLSNSAYKLTVTYDGKDVLVRLDDKAMDFVCARCLIYTVPSAHPNQVCKITKTSTHYPSAKKTTPYRLKANLQDSN